MFVLFRRILELHYYCTVFVVTTRHGKIFWENNERKTLENTHTTWRSGTRIGKPVPGNLGAKRFGHRLRNRHDLTHNPKKPSEVHSLINKPTTRPKGGGRQEKLFDSRDEYKSGSVRIGTCRWVWEKDIKKNDSEKESNQERWRARGQYSFFHNSNRTNFVSLPFGITYTSATPAATRVDGISVTAIFEEKLASDSFNHTLVEHASGKLTKQSKFEMKTPRKTNIHTVCSKYSKRFKGAANTSQLWQIVVPFSRFLPVSGASFAWRSTLRQY